jgi:hypothetical protein
MDGEFLAVYLATDGARIVLPLVKDDHGNYRLACVEGMRPIQHWIGDLEFSHYEMADARRSDQFINSILTVPVRKARPALKHEENAA